jgi:hypothetical protein
VLVPRYSLIARPEDHRQSFAVLNKPHCKGDQFSKYTKHNNPVIPGETQPASSSLIDSTNFDFFYAGHWYHQKKIA